MNYDDHFLSKCPHCGRKKWLPIPYNIDLSKRIVWTICGKCEQPYEIKLMMLGEPIQCFFKRIEQPQKGVYEREYRTTDDADLAPSLMQSSREGGIRVSQMPREEVWDMLTPI